MYQFYMFLDRLLGFLSPELQEQVKDMGWFGAVLLVAAGGLVVFIIRSIYSSHRRSQLAAKREIRRQERETAFRKLEVKLKNDQVYFFKTESSDLSVCIFNNM